MLALFPFISFLLIFLVFVSRTSVSWRQAFLKTAVVVGLLTVLATELLSACHALNMMLVAIFWFCVIGIMFWVFLQRKTYISTIGIDLSLLPRAWLGVAFLAALLAVMGAMTAPNSFDSMTYHLPRVMHWAQNGSVAPYATHLTSQLWIPPMAEYASLHLYLLSGGDNLFWIVQWGAYVGCIIAASLIAQVLHMDKRGQAAAAVIAATIPMAILQSTSTQTDLVAAFWSMSAIYWLGLWLTDDRRNVVAVLCAASFALGLFTKGTPFFFAGPFIMFVMVGCLVKREWQRSIILLSLIIAVVVIVSGPFLARMHVCSKEANIMDHEWAAVNHAWDGPSLLSNLLRGVALQQTTPSQHVNDLIKKAFMSAHAMIGVKIDDPRITFGPAEFLNKRDMFYEARAASFLHFWLWLIAVSVILMQRKRYGWMPVAYALALMAGMFFLTGYLKWHLWLGRFHMGFFLLGAPLIALVLDKADPSRRLLKGSVIFLFFVALPWVVFNTSRPLFGEHAIGHRTRSEQYFVHDQLAEQGYIAAATTIKSFGCDKVGLILAADEWEYPLWVFLRDVHPQIEIRHVNVGNSSRQYEDLSWAPCAILRRENVTERNAIVVHGKTYVPANYVKPLMIYTPGQDFGPADPIRGL